MSAIEYNLLSPPVGKDGKHVEGIWVDEQALEFVDKGLDLGMPRRARATAGGASSTDRRTH